MDAGRVNEIIVTLSDLKRLFTRHWRWVIKSSCVVATLVGLATLVLPIEYTQRAHLRVLSVQDLSSQMTFDVGKVVSVLTSQPVLQQVVEKLGLQIQCSALSWEKQLWKRCAENLLFGMGWQPSVDEDRFYFRDVQFLGNKGAQFFVRCDGKGAYAILNERRQVLAEQTVGESLQFPGGHLTLYRLPSFLQVGRLYPVKLIPLADSIAQWGGRLKMSAPKFDRSKLLINIDLKVPDRFMGTEILETWMGAWLERMKAKQYSVYEEYLAELEKKAQAMFSMYHEALVERANYLRQNVAQYGIADLSKEMEALMRSKDDYTSRLMAIDIELQKMVEDNDRQEALIDSSSDRHPLSASFKRPVDVAVEFSGLNLTAASSLFAKYMEIRDLIHAQQQPIQIKLTGDTHALELESLDMETLSRKIVGLRYRLKELLQSEKRMLLTKLEELKQMSQTLHDRWYQQSLLELHQEQMVAMSGGWGQLAGALNRHRSLIEEDVPLIDAHLVPYSTKTALLSYRVLLGFVMTCFGLYVSIFIRDLFTGFPLSESVLKIWKLPVLGTTRREKHSTTAALQALIEVVQEKQCHRIVLVQGGYVESGSELARLLSNRGYSTLVIDVSCPAGHLGTESFSMDRFPIESYEGYDRLILSKDVGIEELCSIRFKAALEQLTTRYQFVILATQAKGSHIEGQLASKLGDVAMIVIDQERAKDVECYFQEAWQTGRIQFLCMDL